MLTMLQMAIGYKPKPDKLRSGSTNTAISFHQKKTFANVESDLPFEVEIQKAGKMYDIISKGHFDFDGQL